MYFVALIELFFLFTNFLFSGLWAVRKCQIWKRGVYCHSWYWERNERWASKHVELEFFCDCCFPKQCLNLQSSLRPETWGKWKRINYYPDEMFFWWQLLVAERFFNSIIILLYFIVLLILFKSELYDAPFCFLGISWSGCFHDFSHTMIS